MLKTTLCSKWSTQVKWKAKKKTMKRKKTAKDPQRNRVDSIWLQKFNSCIMVFYMQLKSSKEFSATWNSNCTLICKNWSLWKQSSISNLTDKNWTQAETQSETQSGTHLLIQWRTVQETADLLLNHRFCKILEAFSRIDNQGKLFSQRQCDQAVLQDSTTGSQSIFFKIITVSESNWTNRERSNRMRWWQFFLRISFVMRLLCINLFRKTFMMWKWRKCLQQVKAKSVKFLSLMSVVGKFIDHGGCIRLVSCWEEGRIRNCCYFRRYSNRSRDIQHLSCKWLIDYWNFTRYQLAGCSRMPMVSVL